MNKKILPWLITLCALGLGGTAGYYSIIGLSKLFAGEATAVIIMASFLEASKLVLATLLHSYWENLNKILKTYYISALVILSLITSAGIYGMLSSGYQKTASQLLTVSNQQEYLNQKIDFYQKDLNRYEGELNKISDNISILSNAKSSTTQIKDNTVEGGVRSVVSTAELRIAQQRITVEEENRKEIQSKRQITADSLQKLQLQILELENNNEIAGELGPLKYLSNLTNISMDRIINWLLLIIIFVFDPLAISLVIAANFAFEKSKSTVKSQTLSLTPEINEILNNNIISEIEENYDKSVNDEHPPIPISSKDIDTNNDGVIDNKEILKAEDELHTLKIQMANPNISSWRRSKLQKRINEIQYRLDQEEDTIKVY